MQTKTAFRSTRSVIGFIHVAISRTQTKLTPSLHHLSTFIDGSRISTWSRFDEIVQLNVLHVDAPSISSYFLTTHPQRNTLVEEPFSTSAQKILTLVLATVTKIRTNGISIKFHNLHLLPRIVPHHCSRNNARTSLLPSRLPTNDALICISRRWQVWVLTRNRFKRPPFSGPLYSAG